ncbi:MAG: alpha-L-fucosidase [Phycisphaeraceae bacterium]
MTQVVSDRGPHRLPENEQQYQIVRYYIEDDPVAEYQHASPEACESFRDLKYGIRIHWGLYSLGHTEASWPLVLSMSDQQRQEYQQLYQRFNPTDFDADQWMRFFADNGLRMFAMTTKHHDGFSLFDTRTRVKQRVNWTAPGGPKIEDCDIAYSVMDSPLRRDIVKELCDAAQRRGIKVDLYFSHPDWYDADFRGFAFHPVQPQEFLEHPELYGNNTGFLDPPRKTIVPNTTAAQTARMMQRYGDQLRELLTGYGKVDMICFDQCLGPKIWPELRRLLIELRSIQPDVMFRARGIGNYGDYYTPEDYFPDGKEPTSVPWFVVHRLAKIFAYDPEASNYRDGAWIISGLIDTVAKGGNLMIALGPDEHGHFHPRGIEALEEAGRWLAINGEAIYATRPRDGTLWREGDEIRFTRSKDGRCVYAICRTWPGSVLRLQSVRARPGSVIQMLGVSQPLTWRQEADRLIVELPDGLQQEARRPCPHAWAFRIAAQG